MKIKTIITGILLLFVGLSVIYLVVGESRPGQTTDESSVQPSVVIASDERVTGDLPETPEEPEQQSNQIVTPVPNAGYDNPTLGRAQHEQPTTKPEATAGQYSQEVKVAERDNPTVEQVAPEEQATQPGNPKTNEPEHTVIAYYFHGTQRCATCRTIEAYTEEALKVGFSEELSIGRLKWQPMNVDAPGNGHFVADYQLTTRSVVLVDMWDDQQRQWKNLNQVWQLVRDKQAFTSYLQEETRNYLAGKYE